MLAEEPVAAAYLGGPLGASRPAGGPRIRSASRQEPDPSDVIDNDAEGEQSPSLSPRKGRRSSRKKARISRKKVKHEPTENAREATATVADMNSTLSSTPTAPQICTSYPPQPQPILPEGPAAAVARSGPAGPRAIQQGLEPRILPFAEPVGPPGPPYAAPQGMCIQGPSWQPLPQKTEDMGIQGPAGASEGPPTETEVRAVVSFLIRRPLRNLKLAPCLMAEVEKAWWMARQQQQQQQEGEALQQHHQLKVSAGQEEPQHNTETDSKQNLTANTIDALRGGPATASAEAASPAPVPVAAAAAACTAVGFAAAGAYRGGADAASASGGAASSRSTAPLCAPPSSDCGMPFQPLQPVQQHELGQRQLQQQQLQEMREQRRLQHHHQHQQDCQGGPTLNFDEPPMLQLDSSPKLPVEGRSAGPPQSPQGPPLGPPGAPPAPPGAAPLGWLDG